MSLAALILSVLFTFWLFARDRKLRPMTSVGLWIPLFWILIVGSRSVTAWYIRDIDPDMKSVTFLEGTPTDRNIFLVLILSGVVVLWRRRLDWGKIVSSNRCLFAFLLYCGISVLWSDYPFVSLKAWVKDLGNIVMIMIILTETDHVLAIKAVFARYIYFAVPLSVVLIMYFPDLGSYYQVTAGEYAYCGVTTHKNQLGQLLFISGMFLVGDLIGKQRGGSLKTEKVDLLVRAVLLVMVIWLIKMAHSSTSIGCLALGTVIIFAMQFPAIKRQAKHLGTYSLVIVMLFLFISSFSAVTHLLVEMLGRDMTLTGRTEIWASLLRESVNHILGKGFHSFWLAPGVMEYYGYINQAHNGYLETYLNGGFVGVFLLITVIVSAGIKAKKELLDDCNLGILFFSFLIVAVIANLTEAMFSRLTLLWFIFLLVSVNYPLSVKPKPDDLPESRFSLKGKGRVPRYQGLAGALRKDNH